MKKAPVIVALIALAALSFPLSNLLHKPSDETEKLLAQIQDSKTKKAATILQGKCIDCHSSQTRLPFYMNFPLAHNLIAKDIEEGTEEFNLNGKFANNGAGFTELDLARLEGVLNDHSMPPLRYVALHWDASLSEADTQDLRGWIYQLRSQRQIRLAFMAILPVTPLSRCR